MVLAGMAAERRIDPEVDPAILDAAYSYGQIDELTIFI
jgi:hypothetical protein